MLNARCFMAHGSWLMAHRSWLKAHGSWPRPAHGRGRDSEIRLEMIFDCPPSFPKLPRKLHVKERHVNRKRWKWLQTTSKNKCIEFHDTRTVRVHSSNRRLILVIHHEYSWCIMSTHDASWILINFVPATTKKVGPKSWVKGARANPNSRTRGGRG